MPIMRPVRLTANVWIPKVILLPVKYGAWKTQQRFSESCWTSSISIAWDLLDMQTPAPHPRNTESKAPGWSFWVLELSGFWSFLGFGAFWVQSALQVALMLTQDWEPLRFQQSWHMGQAPNKAYWSDSDLGHLGFSLIYPYLQVSLVFSPYNSICFNCFKRQRNYMSICS